MARQLYITEESLNSNDTERLNSKLKMKKRRNILQLLKHSNWNDYSDATTSKYIVTWCLSTHLVKHSNSSKAEADYLVPKGDSGNEERGAISKRLIPGRFFLIP